MKKITLSARSVRILGTLALGTGALLTTATGAGAAGSTSVATPAAPHTAIRAMTKGSMERLGIIPSLDTISPVSTTSVAAASSVKAAAARLATGGPLLTFEGLTDTAGVLPAQASLGVGPADMLESARDSVQAFSTSGVAESGPISNGTFWSAVGGPCSNPAGDWTTITYDRYAGRFVYARGAHSSLIPHSTECIAISTGSAATGPFTAYSFDVSDTQWSDYPQFGVGLGGYYLGVNLYSQASYVRQYQTGDELIAFDRAEMLAGATSVQTLSTMLPTTYESVVPVMAEGAMAPSGTTEWFVGGPMDGMTTGSSLLFWNVTPNWSANSGSFVGPNQVPVLPYNLQICPTTPMCGAQPGTSVQLQAWSDNLMLPVALRNFGSYQSLIGAFSVAGPNNTPAIQWFEIRTNPKQMYQQGVYVPDSIGRYNESIAMDGSGDIALGYTASSTTKYPSVAYTGRVPGDALGAMEYPDQTMWAGGGSQTSYGRWGDASTLVLAPDDCTFWYAGEYYPVSSPGAWHTRIGSFRFPNCTPASAS